MDYQTLIKQRFSTKRFKATKIDEETLHSIIETGLVAPTAVNAQAFRIYVLKSEVSLQKLDKLTRCRYGAPVVLLFVYDENEQWHNPLQAGVTSGVEDVSIVATHVMLAAYDLGVDSCWINYFPNKELEEAFGIPSNEHSVLLLDLGYREDGVEPLPNHFKKRDYHELVKEK